MLNDNVAEAYDLMLHDLSSQGYQARRLEEGVVEQCKGKYAVAVDIGDRWFVNDVHHIVSVVAHNKGLVAEVDTTEQGYIIGLREKTLGDRISDFFTAVGGYFFWLGRGY
ncbi:hypothetical protein KY328_03925 [Candidatus Woesearchaeota archaeon]|nr:hypothetical protein [Candidatus Woesearchaeota archaeon]MBW3022045.1 hypothetical protein [Candidatus Woesearchaeota archaeon]